METLGNKIVCAKIEANGKKTTKTLVNIYRNIDGMTTIAGTLTNSSLMTSYPVLMVMARVPPCARQSLQLYSVHRTVQYTGIVVLVPMSLILLSIYDYSTGDSCTECIALLPIISYLSHLK